VCASVCICVLVSENCLCMFTRIVFLCVYMSALTNVCVYLNVDKSISFCVLECQFVLMGATLPKIN